MLIKTQTLTISPFLPRHPIKSHPFQTPVRCLGVDSVVTRRKLGVIATTTPNFQGNPAATRRKIKLERITRSCIGTDREIGETDEEEGEEEKKREDQVKQSVWEQMKEIVKFTGPAMGMWICGPLMSLIDTVVIGQGSSVELAALGTLFYQL